MKNIVSQHFKTSFEHPFQEQLKSDLEKLKETIIQKEQDILTKVSVINQLKEQNIQVSDELANYSEQIKEQIKALQKEREKCEEDSQEKQRSLEDIIDSVSSYCITWTSTYLVGNSEGDRSEQQHEQRSSSRKRYESCFPTLTT